MYNKTANLGDRVGEIKPLTYMGHQFFERANDILIKFYGNSVFLLISDETAILLL